ncbi:MAG: hypothetical protein ACI8ZN_000445 [Bacteroidia bacterium]
MPLLQITNDSIMNITLLKPAKVHSYIASIMIMAVLGSCASGKKRFEQGDYDTATYQAINRLRKDPDNKKAIKYLPMAYNHAVNFHLDQIKILKASEQEFKNDDIVMHYSVLNDLYNQLVQCPKCLKVVKQPKMFQTEFNDASLAASKAHFNAGLRELNLDTKQSGRNAYHHFSHAKSFTPSYFKIDEYLEQSLNLGTVHVLMEDIPIHSRNVSLTNEFFQNQMLEAAQRLNYTFVRFYRQADLNASNRNPDEVLVMLFDDFVVGQTLLKEKETQITRDSVIIGKTSTSEGEKDVYGTAKAKYFYYEKIITSTGLLDFKVVDAYTGATLLQRKLPGTYIWKTDWANYQGMEEALTKEQLNLCRKKEIRPPAPQDLFVSFTQPIYNQVIDEVRRRYRNVH